MTTTTNGKRKHNKVSEPTQTAPPPAELAQSTAELEELLNQDVVPPNKDAQTSVEPLKQDQEAQATDLSSEPTQELQTPLEKPLSADEILKQSKQQTQKDEPVDELPQAEDSDTQNTDLVPKTASSEVNAALTQAAQSLVELNQESKKKRIETGILEGIEDAKDIRLGKQLGTLLSLAEAERTDVEELAEQLDRLRSHTDTQTADVVTEAIKELGIDLNAIREGKPQETKEKKPSPLESTLSIKLPGKSSSFKIL